MKNPYTVLGVSKSASIDEIKQAFRHLAKATHPDLNGGDPNLTNRFREIAEAYAILSDPTRRNEYDSLYVASQKEKNVNATSTINNNDIKATASFYESYIHHLYEQVKPYKKQALRSLWTGIAWLVGGVVISLISYAYAVETALHNGSGTYFIMWGAVVFGAIQAIRGFVSYVKINGAVAKVETELWKSMKA